MKNPAKTDVYMLHQNYTSFDWMNCQQNVLIAKKIKGRVVPEDIFTANQMLEKVGLIECTNLFAVAITIGRFSKRK